MNKDSGELYQYDTFSYTFYDKGEYNYQCSKHPSMIGKVIVVDKEELEHDEKDDD